METVASTPQLPWTLRDRYTFTIGNASFIYLADSGEWRVQVEGVGPVVERAGYGVVLTDGTRLAPCEARNGTSSIKRHNDEFGAGAVIVVEMPTTQGISVRHSLKVSREWPFLVLGVEVENKRDEPVEISRIESARFSLDNLSSTGQVRQRAMRVRGPYLVPARGPRHILTVIEDVDNEFTVAIGPLSEGIAESKTSATSYEGRWQVSVVSEFEPPAQVGSGQTLQCDPVWISYSVSRPVDVDQYYAWMYTHWSKPHTVATTPRAWVSVPADASVSRLYEAAGSWKGLGITHALVPAAWETVPGSLKGGWPTYPRDIAEVASRLQAMRVTPGLTLDPLAVEGGNPAWTVRSADGRDWVNPAAPEGRKYAVEKLRKVVDWGFGFVVVESSAIPNDVLKQLGLTRVRADAYAFEIMAEAAPGLPILPSPEWSLGADTQGWLEAAGGTSRFREYGVVSGPVRFDLAKVRELDDSLITALLFYGGPIEVLGDPPQPVKAEVGWVLKPTHMVARPLSVGSAPKLWHVLLFGREGSEPREGVVVFPGAPTLELARAGLPESTSVWQIANGEFMSVVANQASMGPSVLKSDKAN